MTCGQAPENTQSYTHTIFLKKPKNLKAAKGKSEKERKRKNREREGREEKRKNQIIQRTTISLTEDFSTAAIDTRRQWNNISNR